MKKISFFALAACALAFNACNGDDAPDTPKTRIETISFEDCEFAANKSDNTGAYNEEIAYEEFGATFAHLNYYNMYGGAVIGGSADTSADGASQSSHLRVNGDKTSETPGAAGTAKFVSFCLSKYVKDYDMSFSFAEDKEHKIVSAFVNNSACMYQLMKFGRYSTEGFVAGDYCEVVFTGYDAAGEETGSVSFALGDYRDGKEFVCEDWTKVDLAALGTVNKVVITVDASNASGLVGAEATAGFSVCLDQIEFEVPAGE